MAETSSFTPASYDQYVAGVLQDTGTLLTPPKTKAPAAQDASLKAQTGPYDTYIGDTLKDVDALLAPPKTPPKDSVAPEGGPMDTLIGGAEGVWNTVKGFVGGPAGEGLGLADIPVHAFGKATGLYDAPEPEKVRDATQGFLSASPGTRRGERTSEAVQDYIGDLFGWATGGKELSTASRIAGEMPAGPDTSIGAGFQSRFGIPVPGVTKDNPEGIVHQTPEQTAQIEKVEGYATLPLFGAKPEARAVPLEEPVEPPPPSSQPHATEPAYAAPEVHKTVPPETPAAASPGATPAAPAKDALDGLPGNHASMALPKAYKGAKPRYGDLQLKFESDVEKALYIVANPKTKSASHDVYMSWLQKSLGMDEDAVMNLARASRARTISLAKQGQSDIPAYKPVTQTGTPNLRQSGVAADVRKAYDTLTPEQRESTALKDSQTGLYSRGMYDRIGGQTRPQVFFDLRDLKQANDVHGHSYGDAIIKAFGDAARAAGVHGQMFRYGGDEFTMLVDGPEGLAQARKLQQALQGATVEAILPDGTKITTKGIDADYGYGKNKDAADQAAYAAKRANKAAPADAQAGGERPSVGRAPSQGDAVQGQPGQQQHPDLSRRFAGTQSSTHTPYPEGSPPGDYVLGKIRLKQGDRDVVVPVKTEFETPGDEELYKVGEQVLKTWGEDKEPRPNTASPSERELLMRMRQYLAKEDPAWRQNDDRANLAYARQFAREVRDHHQRGYNVLRDHLEENFPDNPKGELRANPHKYAFSTKVPKWQPRDLVTHCFK